MTNTNTTTIECCVECGSYHKLNSPLCAEFAEFRRFQAWLKTQGMETSNDGKVGCSVHGKRAGSVIRYANGRVEYLCYHCKFTEFRTAN